MEVFAAIIISVILIGLSILQIVVATGKPYGQFVWGGQHTVLPKKLRIGSVFSVALYTVFIMYALAGAAIVDLPSFLAASANTVLWILSGYMSLGVVMNGLSRSYKERYMITPLVFIMSVCYVFLAINY